MKLLAMIPARSGSKGVKNKNIKSIGQYNLVHRAYRFIKKNLPADEIIISTDYSYSEFSNFLPKLQYRKRPIELSKDDSSIVDVCIDAVNFLHSKTNKKFTDLLLLQPTSPFRESIDLNLAISLYKEKSLKSLASVSKVIQHPYEVINGIGYNWEPIISWHGHKNRQELDSYYFINGCFYIVNLKEFLEQKTFVNKNTYMYLTRKKYCIDIDDEEDFDLAQKLLE